MGKERNWTPDDREYLEDNWGTLSMGTLMKNLNRSEAAILIKVHRWGLSAFLDSGDYVSCNQLSHALGYGNWNGYRATSWVKNRKFPVRTKRVNNNSFKVVYLTDFWKWAKQNQSFLEFSRFEENVLGKEPQWVKAKRKRDIHRAQQVNTTNRPWTKSDDDRLRHLLRQHKHSYFELSTMLNRTCGAIQRRCCDLNLKERPVKADNHTKWTQQELDTLEDMISHGVDYEAMSDALGRSTKAIRGLVYRLYGSENLDKARQNGGAA